MSQATGRKYLDPQVLNKITRLDLKARLIVEGFITGLHKSPFHGYSVEFASHREYVPGDEIKHIDWKVWARGDRFYVKQYEEETNLKSTILLDCSRSMGYPAVGAVQKDKTEAGSMSKFDYASTLAASLAYLLQLQQDAVGLVTFDTGIRLNLPASTHRSHLKQLFHELEKTKPDRQSDMGDVFHGLAEQIRSRGLIVLISDLFVDNTKLVKALRHFRHKRHEVVVFHVMHDHELTFPFQDDTLFRGLEVSLELLTEPRALRKSYLEAVDRFRTQVRKSCADCGIDYVLLSTKDPLDAALSSYLAFRQRTLRTAGRR